MILWWWGDERPWEPRMREVYTIPLVFFIKKYIYICPGFEVSLMFLLASLQILFSGNSIDFIFFYSAGEASQSSPVSGS